MFMHSSFRDIVIYDMNILSFEANLWNIIINKADNVRIT
jgi:hypothetical protein